ncbi:MAG TPA: hypothetical protein VN722_11780 [Hanamia sp.]|nr:hypothetical protein [Hanamia sp.]
MIEILGVLHGRRGESIAGLFLRLSSLTIPAIYGRSIPCPDSVHEAIF